MCLFSREKRILHGRLPISDPVLVFYPAEDFPSADEWAGLLEMNAFCQSSRVASVRPRNTFAKNGAVLLLTSSDRGDDGDQDWSDCMQRAKRLRDRTHFRKCTSAQKARSEVLLNAAICLRRRQACAWSPTSQP